MKVFVDVRSKNSIFSKSNDNIKNLAREILDMNSLKLQLEGFDYSFKSEAWKIRSFKLKKWFFKHQSSFKLYEAWKNGICGRFWLFEKFLENVSGCYLCMKLKLWDPRNTSEPITHRSESYKMCWRKIIFWHLDSSFWSLSWVFQSKCLHVRWNSPLGTNYPIRDRIYNSFENVSCAK